MPRHKPPSIEEIGLKNHLEQMGIDYEEFCRRDDLNEPDTIIGRAISKDPNKPISRVTVAKWRRIRRKELSNA